MSQWCNTCSRSKVVGRWTSCTKDCPAFGKTFEELAEIVIRQQEEHDALRWTNKQLIKNEKKKRTELWKKAVNQFMDKLKTEYGYVSNLSLDGKEVVDICDIESVAREMIDHIKE